MRRKVVTARGRPSGEHHSYADIRVLEYLAWISVKHRVDSGKLFNGLIDASNHEESACGKLSVICRTKTQDHVIFLIRKGQEVVAQVSVSHQILAKTNPLKDFASELLSARDSAQESRSKHYRIKDLKPGMKQVDIKAKVLEVSQPRIITTRAGSYASVANALISDETGNIHVPLWNKQIEEFSVGDSVQVERASVTVFRGSLQLKIGRSGKIKRTR